jgi:hypothetical protein
MPSSENFNAICYLNRYPDLKTAVMYFSADGTWKYGNASNRKLKKVSDDPLWHWQNFGMAEGRVSGCDIAGTNYSNDFNAAAYMARYYDVRIGLDEVSGKPNGWNLNPLGHYQQIGINQGRHPGFEIIKPSTPLGIVSPGTVISVPDDITTAPVPGDNAPPPVIIDTSMDTPTTTTDKTGDVMTWITANPLIIAGAAAVILILIHESKKHKKRK